MIPELSCVSRKQEPLVLAVEDNEDNLLVISYVLESLNCRFLAKTNGFDIVKIVKKYRPNLILMDIILPDINGIDIFYQLQEDPLTSFIPVVAMTALAMTEEIQKIQKAGFHACITKPYMLEELEEMIIQQLKQTRITPQCQIIQQQV